MNTTNAQLDHFKTDAAVTAVQDASDDRVVINEHVEAHWDTDGVDYEDSPEDTPLKMAQVLPYTGRPSASRCTLAILCAVCISLALTLFYTRASILSLVLSSSSSIALSPLNVGLPRTPPFPLLPPPSPPNTFLLELGGGSQPVIGERRGWRLSSEHGILFNMRNPRLPGTHLDTACSSHVTKLPHAGIPLHIIELAPHVSSRANVSFVHHMDVFLCDDHISEPSDRDCLRDQFLSSEGPCYAMVWAYDKGGLARHTMPPGAGFRVGAGTPFTHILLQIHYQLPYGGVTAMQLAEEGFRDASGVAAVLCLSCRSLDAWTFEFMEMNMAIPPGAQAVEYASHMPASAVGDVLGAEIRSAGGSIALRQAHAHAHHHATRVSLHRQRRGTWETLLELNPYCGYGACQHFHDLPAGTELQLGDALEFRCLYNNTLNTTLHYGLSADMEMCGTIIIYTSHDAALSTQPMWFNGGQGTQRSMGGTPRVVSHDLARWDSD